VALTLEMHCLLCCVHTGQQLGPAPCWDRLLSAMTAGLLLLLLQLAAV
jgi:hypothetical protein